MVRTIVATSIVLAAACGSKTETHVVGAGPTYTPLIANGLRGVAAQCTTTKTAKLEKLHCTSVQARIDISISGDRVSDLSIGLRSMILPEAKGHFTYALKAILGQPGVDQLLERMAKLRTGDRAELTIGNAKIDLAAGGASQIAPEYRVAVSWGITP